MKCCRFPLFGDESFPSFSLVARQPILLGYLIHSWQEGSEKVSCFSQWHLYEIKTNRLTQNFDFRSPIPLPSALLINNARRLLFVPDRSLVVNQAKISKFDGPNNKTNNWETDVQRMNLNQTGKRGRTLYLCSKHRKKNCRFMARML